MYQYWFTSNVLPEFTQENRDFYRNLVENQFFNVGNEVNGRHLVRCMTTPENMSTMIEYLQSLGKNPRIIGALDQEGNEIIVRDFSEYNSFFIQDSDGNIPPGNTSSGWVDFNELI